MTNRETPPLRMIGDQQYVNYRDVLEKIRLAFPQPVSDPIHDSYFVHSVMRALDQVDALKTHLPMLGTIIPGDFGAARQATLPNTMSSVEDVTVDLVGYLRGMTIFGHPRRNRTLSLHRRFQASSVSLSLRYTIRISLGMNTVSW